jgi:hypothetical protein
MGLQRTLQILFFPILFVFTAPLAIFAATTTLMAFSVLYLQMLVVYLDLLLSLFPAYLTGRGLPRPPKGSNTLSPVSSGPSSPQTGAAAGSPPRRDRPRRQSSASMGSASMSVVGGSTTPTSEAGLGLIPSVGPDRDFEGVGGWRVGGKDNDVWTSINSRLEMPDRQHPHPHVWGKHSGKGHHRALSGPSAHGQGDFLMMRSRTRSPDKTKTPQPLHYPVSPNSSRVRVPAALLTPPALAMMDGESYFTKIWRQGGKAKGRDSEHGEREAKTS